MTKDVRHSGVSLADPMEAWKARGRELNALHTQIAKLVNACGLRPTPEEPIGDLVRVEAQVDRLRRFVEWVAAHRLVEGTYADDAHPYTEWVAPEGHELEFGEVHEHAEEVLNG